jgi:sulfonate transport system permease protein
MKIKIKLEKFKGVIVPFLLLLSWWTIAHMKLFPDYLCPAPGKVTSTAIRLYKSGDLVFNIKMSLFRVVGGFVIGSAVGFIIGASMGFFRIVEKIVGPLFHAFRQVPLLGWVPLIVLWAGIGEAGKIVLIALGASYPVALNTFQGIRSVKKEFIEVARVFEFSNYLLLTTVILPSALPEILTGLRLALNKSWMMVVAAEIFIAAKGGIGDMMWDARDRFHMDIVIVGFILIGLIGFALNESILLIENSFLSWRKTFQKG